MQNRPIDPNLGPLSLSSFYKGNDSLLVLLSFLENLPYRRISDPENLSLIVFENCGTCSSKHAFLQIIAEEQGWEDFELILCMYKMNADNTPGIGTSLQENGLEHIPEAHCYVRVDSASLDVTRPGADVEKIKNDILLEKKIAPDQVGTWKKNFHRNYIADWVSAEEGKFDSEQIWKIREVCISEIQKHEEKKGPTVLS